MEVGAVTSAVGVDFIAGHGEWSDENFIDVTVEGAEGLIVTDSKRSVRDLEVTTDIFRGRDGTVDVEVDGVSVVGEADVVPAVGWGGE